MSKRKSAMGSLLEGGLKNSNFLNADISVAVRDDEVLTEEKITLPTKNTNTEEERNNLIEIDPADCSLWSFADRPDNELGDIESLANSMKLHGQQEPVLVRDNNKNSDIKFDIIFGNRRWRAAKLAGIKLIAIHKNLTDKQAALAQKEENENREQLSDFARAQSYHAQVTKGVFRSEAELSEELGINKKTFNDIMAYMRVPEEIRDSIPNFRNISRKMAVKLSTLSKKKENIPTIIKLATDIADNKITSTNIDLAIISQSETVSKRAVQSSSMEVKTKQGDVLGRLKKLSNGKVQFEFKTSTIKHLTFDDLYEKLTNLL